MLYNHNVFEISHICYGLLANQKGNNGRALRRFLMRIAPNGIISQVLVSQAGYSANQLDAIEKYAVKVAEEANFYLSQPPEGWSFIGTIREDSFCLIQNSYKLEYPVQSATVKQLRAMVALIVVLADNMQKFVVEPNKNALQLYPQYVYRNLSSTKWLIQGADLLGGSGILEWCHDEADAQQRLGLMTPHLRFSNLELTSSPTSASRLPLKRKGRGFHLRDGFAQPREYCCSS
jgi:hypothetical protein